MGQVTFSNTRDVKILETSFPWRTFPTVGVRAERNVVEVVALDESLSVAAKLKFDQNAFSSFQVSDGHLLSVDTKHFTKYLGRAFSGYYEGLQVTLSLMFNRRSLGISMDVDGKYKYRRTLRDIPSGTKELPRLGEGDVDATYSTEDTSLLKQAFDAFDDSREIHLQIRGGVVTFAKLPVTEEDSLKILTGDCHGEAQTTLLRGLVDSVSKVHGLSGLESLEMSLIDRGLSRFEYSFDTGHLTYWVVPIAPEE